MLLPHVSGQEHPQGFLCLETLGNPCPAQAQLRGKRVWAGDSCHIPSGSLGALDSLTRDCFTPTVPH